VGYIFANAAGSIVQVGIFDTYATTNLIMIASLDLLFNSSSQVLRQALYGHGFVDNHLLSFPGWHALRFTCTDSSTSDSVYGTVAVAIDDGNSS
jgi:hypothetical protein